MKLRSISLLLILAFLAVYAFGQDRVRFSGVYNMTDFPSLQPSGATTYVNGGTAEVDVKLFGKGNFRASVAYNFKFMNDVPVYPMYFDGMNIVHLYRNGITHSAGGQVGYAIGDAFEPIAGLFAGTRRIHPDAPRQTVRTWRLGVNILFHSKSRIFLKGYVDSDTPYGALPSGFINPPTRTLSIGGGLRF